MQAQSIQRNQERYMVQAPHSGLSLQHRKALGERFVSCLDAATVNHAIAGIAACIASPLASAGTGSTPTVTTPSTRSPSSTTPQQGSSRSASPTVATTDSQDATVNSGSRNLRPVVTAFHSAAVPPISLVAYARRLMKYTHSGPLGILLGVVLMARYCKATGHRPSPVSAHRLLLTSVVVALKTNFDIFYTNKYYADVGGITCAELNNLEVELLNGLQFSAMATLPEAEQLASILCTAGAKIHLNDQLHVITPDQLSDVDYTHSFMAAALDAYHALTDVPVLVQPFAGPPRRAPEQRNRQPNHQQSISFVLDDAAGPADRHKAVSHPGLPQFGGRSNSNSTTPFYATPAALSSGTPTSGYETRHGSSSNLLHPSRSNAMPSSRSHSMASAMDSDCGISPAHSVPQSRRASDAARPSQDH